MLAYSFGYLLCISSNLSENIDPRELFEGGVMVFFSGCFRNDCRFWHQSITGNIALFRASFRLFLMEINREMGDLIKNKINSHNVYEKLDGSAHVTPPPPIMKKSNFNPNNGINPICLRQTY